MMSIKVLVIDDSALMRALLTEMINTAPDLEVVGGAPDPLVAREMIKALNPDVLTLDVEMPKMDGLDFLERLMRLRPMPTIMVSSLTERGSEVTLRALELGAVDFVTKPRSDFAGAMQRYAEEICEKIRTAFGARLRPSFQAASAAVEPARGASSITPARAHSGALAGASDHLLFIGASTGGTEAIKDVLMGLPPDCPGILMVQHMPEMFTGSFAKRLDRICGLQVKEAEHGERVQPGCAYLAPGHSHLRVRRSAADYVCELDTAEPLNRHRPAVDVLFRSAAQQVRDKAIGVLLTGMGKDGAQGMLEMRRAGAWTLAQDEASCVVWGMPREAVAVGAAVEVAPLVDVAARVLQRLALGARNL
ncbi:MAG: chemotaxis response regulator protein-glutamate methylesterase [Betaproteobacteria bacterium]|nr:chemotaxis response regulator protein-glutamate methylesterase [Betaproteobacteria bacterium]